MTEPTRLYLDDLREYAVRDLNRLRVGDHVLLVHLPSDHPWNARTIAQTKTITSIGVRDEKLPPIIEFGDKYDYIYVTDAGVSPYPKGFNDANFIVKIEELVRFGISPILERKPRDCADFGLEN